MAIVGPPVVRERAVDHARRGRGSSGACAPTDGPYGRQGYLAQAGRRGLAG